MRKRIIISPGDASYNTGDESILAGTISLLREFVPEADLCVFANLPERISRIYGVDAISKGKGPIAAIKSLPSAVREIKRSDLLIWGGGQLLQDISSRLYIPFHISRLALAIAFRKPSIVYSIGAGPIRTFSGRMLTRLLLNRASRITVRDASSADTIAACGVDRAKITQVPDPALVLKPDPHFDAQKCLSNLGIDTQKPIIGVAIRRLFHRNFGLLPISLRVRMGLISPKQRSRFGEFKAEVASFLDYLVSRYGFQVLFLPMYTHKGQNDQGVGRELAELMVQKDNVFHLPPKLECRQMLSIISKMYAMLAVRMHAAVLSAVAGVPLISVHYAPKGESFMSNIGLPNYTLAAEDVGCDILLRRFNELVENYEQIRSVLSNSVRASFSQILSNVSRVRELLGLDPLPQEAIDSFGAPAAVQNEEEEHQIADEEREGVLAV